MIHLKTGALVLLLCLPACGAQLVEFGLDDDGTTGGAPAVISTLPASSAVAVPLTSPVSATFGKAMDAATINFTTFTLRQGGPAISGAVSFEPATNTATFTPTAALALDRRYTATITTGARDTGGRGLVADYVWTFTSANIEVDVAAATSSAVPAPDYLLAVGGLIVRTDANDIVQSATGAAALTAGGVSGQRRVVVDAAGLRTYAELDGAYVAGAEAALTTSIAAVDFALVGADLSATQVRTLIIANIAGGVRSYQAFQITFHPAGVTNPHG